MNSCLAMSKRPPMPRVELIRKRPISMDASLSFHCKTLFTKRRGMFRLVKALSIICWTMSGVIAL